MAFAVSVVCASSVGCSGGGEAVVDTEVQEADIAAALRPVGTFEYRLRDGESGIYRLVLKSDKTYHLEERWPGCRSDACAHIFDGAYRFSGQRERSGGLRTFVALYDASSASPGAWLYTLEYKFQSGKISYVYAGQGGLNPPAVPMELTRSSRAWCAQESDCKTQGLVWPSCRSGVRCDRNLCESQCR